MATFTITGQVKLRNDTAANWTSENPVLSQGELGIETDTLKAKIGDGTTAWNGLGYAWGGLAPDKTRMVEFIKTTNTAAGAALTGVSQDAELYDGKTIFLYLSYAAGSNATLNLTLSDGTTTGAKPLYYTGTARMTTHYGAGSVVSLTYVESVDGWRRADYINSNTYDRTLLNDIRVYAGTNGIKMYALVMQKADGTWESLTTDSGTGTAKTRNTSGFLLGKIWRNAYSKNTASGALTANDYLYDCQPFDLRYSTNCGSTLIERQGVYLVGTIGNDGLFYLDSTWWTQTLPTTEDGKVYIYIGDASSTTECFLVSYNPVYEYRNGAFRLYSNSKRITTTDIDEILA